MTITATLDLQLKPDGLDAAYDVVHATLAATRAFEGNVSVTVVIDVEDPAHVLVIEVWESREADAAYRAWRATPDGQSQLGSLLAAPPTLARFDRTEL